MPRVLVVTGMTHFGRGGIQRETDRLLISMRAGGAAIALASDRAPGEYEPSLVGLEHFPLAYPWDAASEHDLSRAIEAFAPDVIHVIGGGARLLTHVTTHVSVPVVLTIHCVPPFEQTAPAFFGINAGYRMLRNLIRSPRHALWSRVLGAGRFTHAITHSQAILESALRAGCAGTKLRNIPLGWEPSPIASTRVGTNKGATFSIVSVGGMVHHKGHHDTLRAMAAAREHLPHARLTILGENRQPKYHTWLRRLCTRLGLDDIVTIIADAPEHERASALANADLYVQASHEEGFCLSFIEAAGIVPRLVGTRTGAIAAVAGGDPLARVVTPGDPISIAHALRALSALPASERAIADRVARLRREFSWAAHAEAHVAIYREAVTESRVLAKGSSRSSLPAAPAPS
ncbi:MAG: glycosyltransferase [Phycisphaerales bacterium]|nr:MAG: glycosyltransferase [Phycisphaerales bacterium]